MNLRATIKWARSNQGRGAYLIQCYAVAGKIADLARMRNWRVMVHKEPRFPVNKSQVIAAILGDEATSTSEHGKLASVLEKAAREYCTTHNLQYPKGPAGRPALPVGTVQSIRAFYKGAKGGSTNVTLKPDNVAEFLPAVAKLLPPTEASFAAMLDVWGIAGVQAFNRYVEKRMQPTAKAAKRRRDSLRA
jgi:hypothetical protein